MSHLLLFQRTGHHAHNTIIQCLLSMILRYITFIRWFAPNVPFQPYPPETIRLFFLEFSEFTHAVYTNAFHANMTFGTVSVVPEGIQFSQPRPRPCYTSGDIIVSARDHPQKTITTSTHSIPTMNPMDIFLMKRVKYRR